MDQATFDTFFEGDKISPDDLAERSLLYLLDRLERVQRRIPKWEKFKTDIADKPHKRDLQLQKNLKAVLRMRLRKYGDNLADDQPLLIMIRDALKGGNDGE